MVGRSRCRPLVLYVWRLNPDKLGKTGALTDRRNGYGLKNHLRPDHQTTASPLGSSGTAAMKRQASKCESQDDRL